MFILFFFFARPTDPPSREGGRWETKHFIGMALGTFENRRLSWVMITVSSITKNTGTGTGILDIFQLNTFHNQIYDLL